MSAPVAEPPVGQPVNGSPVGQPPIAPRDTAAPGARRSRPWRLVGPCALVLAAVLPYSTLSVPGVFDGPLNSPGVLQLLALGLVAAGIAMSYDLLFGRAGLLSFGHALYVAVGAYGSTILVSGAHWPLWLAAGVSIGAGVTLALLLGGVALRTTGVAFAMVTLAFAQVGAILVARNPGGVTGGEEGRPADAAHLPGSLVGVVHTANLYWLALGFAALAAFVVHRVDAGPYGRLLTGLRDDERRVAVLGLSPYRVKLLTFVLSAALASTGGVVYALVVGGASPRVTSSEYTLGLLVMVVLGGPGTRWGAMIGALAYTYLDQRLTRAGGVPGADHLPAVLRGPLSQPQFVLGVVFILAVYFAPKGLAGWRARRRMN